MSAIASNKLSTVTPDFLSALERPGSGTSDFISALLQKSQLTNPGSVFSNEHSKKRLILSKKSTTLIQSSASPVGDLASLIFETLVKLKVSVSQYSMHLSTDDRHRIFDELDAILNVDDWHEEDQLPTVESFKNFLKWTIYSRQDDWTSLGVSDEGHLLVAWQSGHTLLTSNFLSKRQYVQWTARINSGDDAEHAAGICSLESFAKLAAFYLD